MTDSGNEKIPPDPGRVEGATPPRRTAEGGLRGRIALGARAMLQQAIVEHGKRLGGRGPLAFILPPGAAQAVFAEMLRDPLARSEFAELTRSIADGDPRLYGVSLFVAPTADGVLIVDRDGKVGEV